MGLYDWALVTNALLNIEKTGIKNYRGMPSGISLVMPLFDIEFVAYVQS